MSKDYRSFERRLRIHDLLQDLLQDLDLRPKLVMHQGVDHRMCLCRESLHQPRPCHDMFLRKLPNQACFHV